MSENINSHVEDTDNTVGEISSLLARHPENYGAIRHLVEGCDRQDNEERRLKLAETILRAANDNENNSQTGIDSQNWNNPPAA